jgi:uncharacterized membrane protein
MDLVEILEKKFPSEFWERIWGRFERDSTGNIGEEKRGKGFHLL